MLRQGVIEDERPEQHLQHVAGLKNAPVVVRVRR